MRASPVAPYCSPLFTLPCTHSICTGRSPTPKRTLNSVATPDRFAGSSQSYDLPAGLRSRLKGAAGGKDAETEGWVRRQKVGSGASGVGEGGWRGLLKCLSDPSVANGMPVNSAALRALEAASLVLNLAAFYMIVSLNKKLFKPPEKGDASLSLSLSLSIYIYIYIYIYMKLLSTAVVNRFFLCLCLSLSMKVLLINCRCR
jgi:hypothetical protein